MNKKLSLSVVQKIAKKAILSGYFPTREVKISSKPDIVDRTRIRAKSVIKRLGI